MGREGEYVVRLYEAFSPEEARRLIERPEIHNTPKHWSWLNMAENELSVLTKQCLRLRFRTFSRPLDHVRRAPPVSQTWANDRSTRSLRNRCKRFPFVRCIRRRFIPMSSQIGLFRCFT